MANASTQAKDSKKLKYSTNLIKSCLESRSDFLDDVKACDCAIVGLGNPGEKYKYNRHNIGFIILDELARILNLDFKDLAKFNAQITNIPSKNIFFLKPQTFMNLSGQSIAPFMRFHKIENLLVIHDELDINFGEIRYKIGGSSGGHNGLKSIDSTLARQDYYRLRFGIGRDEKKSVQDVISYVLGDFSQEQESKLPNLINHAIESILHFLLTFDFAKTQNIFTLRLPNKILDSQNPESNLTNFQNQTNKILESKDSKIPESTKGAICD